jgi:hypothetical protein
MKGTTGTAKSRRGRTLLLIGVIASLCFSVGEGLRLTPFPVSALAEAAAPDDQLKVAELREARLHKYGPLDKPTQAQKRGKRQTPDCQCPPSQSICKPTAYLLHSSCAHPPIAVTSTLLTAGPADRGPPLAA